VANHTLEQKLTSEMTGFRDEVRRAYGQLALRGNTLTDERGASLSKRYEVVDRILASYGTTATIFARDSADFVRVVTNVKKDDGTRADGTRLGQDSKAYRSVMAGREYLGPASILGKPYLTLYAPLIDARRSVYGILYMGIPISQVEAMISSLCRAGTVRISLAMLLLMVVVCLAVVVTVSWTLRPLRDVVHGLQELRRGHLGRRLNSRRRDEVGELSRTLDQFSQELADMVAVMQRIAAGDVSAEVEPADDRDEIRPALRTTIESLRGVIGETRRLTTAAAAGDLAVRGQAERYQGAYGDIIRGINDALTAVIEPLTLAASYIDRISRGELPPRIEAEYHGDFKPLKDNLNQCIGAIDALRLDVRSMCIATLEGHLDQRMDASRHRGIYERIVHGCNEILDTIHRPLQMAVDYINRISKGDIPQKIADDYHGDFNTIKESLNTCIDTLRTLIEQDGGQALAAAAERDLTVRLGKDYAGAFDRMKKNINALLASMDESLQQVARATEQVAAATVQSSQGSEQLSQSTSEQASSLEEVSSSLQEISSMIRQNSGNAREAAAVAEMSRASAHRGADNMARLSEAMGQIKRSSDATARIVRTIDEIAFQTNLLALNAAVEAARAGDAGRGFAVVAEEVRNLAMRSAEAAKNTAALIEESVRNSENGVTINQEVLRNFQDIRDGAARVSEVVAEIAVASEQQDQGIQQVNRAVEQMNQVVQQNAASAEESASISEELSSQAEELRCLVGEFKLTEAADRPAAPPGRAAGPQPPARRPQPPATGHAIDARKIIPLDDTDHEVLRAF
jgi:methyl-accepting chemotaxis protein